MAQAVEAQGTLRVPFHRPSIGEEEIAAVVACLRSGWLTSGHRVQEFEQHFAAYIGAAHAVAVNSCTAAMHLALLAAGIGSGDEVITSPYTFVGTCEAIHYTGARPVFADIDPVTGNIDVAAAEAAITPRTRAALPVHLGGYPCDMVRLQQLASAHDLVLIDDAAHALESRAANGKIGTLGRATCFSFYATKNITTGEGGMLTCADAGLAERARVLRLHGLSRDAWKRYSAAGAWFYDVIEHGFKYNLTDLAAAIGIEQLKKADALHRRRATIAARYTEAFAGIPGLTPPATPVAGTHAWHLYLLQLDHPRLRRNALIDELRERRVQCSVHFIPLHLMTYFRQRYGFRGGELPQAEALYQRVVSLPIFPAMTDGDVDYVIAAVQEIVARYHL